MRAWFALLLAGLLVAALLLGLVGRHHLKKAIFDSQASLIGTLAEKYPALEPELVRQVTEPDKEAAAKGREILSKYGLDGSSPRLETALLQGYFTAACSAASCLPFSRAALSTWPLSSS